MNFLNNIRISTVGWVFIVALTAAGGMFATSSWITFNNISAVKTIWASFELSRSEKAGALSALRKEIGYGGMIHQFKNFVLRKDTNRIGIVNAKLGGAASAIARYRALGLNDKERKALDDIQSMLASYGEALSRSAALAANGRLPNEIDKQVRVDDEAAIRGLDTLDAEVVEISGSRILQGSKSQAVIALRKAMGYGGMIHNFKNLVLRHDHKIMELALKNIAVANEVIRLYAERPLNAAERQAVVDISGVVAAYGSALKIVDELSDQGNSPATIDTIVRIDDIPAFRGFDTLTREVAVQNQIEEAKVDVALNLVATVAKNAAVITLTIIAMLVTASFWLIRAQIIGPITDITGVMSRLAAGDDLDQKVFAVDRRNEIGEMARAVEIFRNTAIDRARADQALQESGERLGAVVDHIFDGIFIIDELGTIQSINPAGSGMFGYGQEDIIGSNINVLMPTPHQSAHDVYLSDYVKTGKSSIIGVGREFEGLRRNGTTFPLHLQIADLNLGTGRFFLGVVRDLTEQKEADRAKDEFVSTVSHELRTPLTSIKGSLGLIRSGSIGELPDKLRTMLDIAYNNSDRLVLLINDILDMEKIKAGKMDYTMAPLDVTSLIDEAIAANKGYGDEHNITFVSHSDISGAVIDADKGRMMQVMTNLMSNAAKFSPDGETVILTALRRGSMIRISVIDKGPGIADDFKKTIFQQFSQADSSDTRKKGGTGLGLSITRAIVQQHKGSIGFETELGEGSTFFIDIPELLEARKTDDDLDGETGGNDRYRILHIEDDESVLQVVAAVLGDSAHIVTARTIAEGTRLLEQGVFDLLILDLTLPDGDGESLILLLEQPGQPSTPVIIFSAKDVPRDISSKVTAVLLKSQTSNDALFDTVRSALGVEIAGK